MNNGREVQRLIYPLENRQCGDQEPHCHVLHGRHLTVRLDGAHATSTRRRPEFLLETGAQTTWDSSCPASPRVRDAMGGRWLYTEQAHVRRAQGLHGRSSTRPAPSSLSSSPRASAAAMAVNHLMGMMLDQPGPGQRRQARHGRQLHLRRQRQRPHPTAGQTGLKLPAR